MIQQIFKRLKTVLLCLIPFLILTACAERKIIVNDLDEREANEIMVFLSTKNIDAYKVAKVEGGAGGGGGALWNIAVDQTTATKAMAILNVNGLPRRQGTKLLDIFAGGGLVSSEAEQKIRYQSGLDAQIANTIRKFDGILDTDVLISYPEEEELGGAVDPNAPKKRVTASVYIKHSGVLDDANSYLIPQIKRLVASSVNGLTFDNVTIIADKSRFADFTMQALSSDVKEDDLVRIWTIMIAKSSVTRFRIIFFSLLFILLFSMITVGWLMFKLSALLTSKDGIDQLLSPTPFDFTHLEIGDKKEEEEKEKPAKKNKKKQATEEEKEDEEPTTEEEPA